MLVILLSSKLHVQICNVNINLIKFFDSITAFVMDRMAVACLMKVHVFLLANAGNKAESSLCFPL